jgi:hypothetical protein
MMLVSEDTSRISKGASCEEIVDDVIAKVAASRIVNDEAVGKYWS